MMCPEPEGVLDYCISGPLSQLPAMMRAGEHRELLRVLRGTTTMAEFETLMTEYRSVYGSAVFWQDLAQTIATHRRYLEDKSNTESSES